MKAPPIPALAALAAIAACACACHSPEDGPRWRAAGASSPREGGTLRFAVTGQIRTLDPTFAYDEIGLYILQPVLATLVRYERGGLTLQPDLAERWELAGDGTTYRFWLRPGITYSDGRAIVAADFKRALERALTTPDSPFGSFLGEVHGCADVLAGTASACAGITAVNERELEIKLDRAAPAFIYLLAMKFAAPQRADHIGGEQQRRGPLASGPFEVASWDEGAKVVLRRNPHYWDRASTHLDTIEMLENVPRDTQFLMFERGELEVAAQLSAPDQIWIASNAAWKPFIHSQPVLAVEGSRMNVRRKPFDDRRVRQALNYAVRKDHLIKLLNGAGVPAHGMLPPGIVGRDETIEPYPFDPGKARALLAEAGYPEGLRLDYVTVNDDLQQMQAAALQGDLADIGVHVDLTVMSLQSYAIAFGKPDGPAFGWNGWVGDFPDPTNFIDAKFHSRMIADENSGNDSFYANPELDQLLDAARGELDVAKRAAMYRRADRILHDDAPWIWGYHAVTTDVRQPYVIADEPHPIWHRDYSTAWLDVGPDGERVER